MAALVLRRVSTDLGRMVLSNNKCREKFRRKSAVGLPVAITALCVTGTDFLRGREAGASSVGCHPDRHQEAGGHATGAKIETHYGGGSYSTVIIQRILSTEPDSLSARAH